MRDGAGTGRACQCCALVRDGGPNVPYVAPPALQYTLQSVLYPSLSNFSITLCYGFCFVSNYIALYSFANIPASLTSPFYSSLLFACSLHHHLSHTPTVCLFFLLYPFTSLSLFLSRSLPSHPLCIVKYAVLSSTCLPSYSFCVNQGAVLTQLALFAPSRFNQSGNLLGRPGDTGIDRGLGSVSTPEQASDFVFVSEVKPQYGQS